LLDGGRLSPKSLGTAVLFGVLALDRATKAWAIGSLAPRGSVRVAPFLRLTYVENTGAAFGVLVGRNDLFIVVAVVLMGALLAWRRRLPPGRRWAHLGLGLILAGAVGNLYDRIAYGYVVDFVDLIVWPVFNVADSAISVGAGLLALDLASGNGGPRKGGA